MDRFPGSQCTCVCAYMRICVCVCMCVRVRVCVRVCVCVCVCVRGPFQPVDCAVDVSCCSCACVFAAPRVRRVPERPGAPRGRRMPGMPWGPPVQRKHHLSRDPRAGHGSCGPHRQDRGRGPSHRCEPIQTGKLNRLIHICVGTYRLLLVHCTTSFILQRVVRYRW